MDRSVAHLRSSSPSSSSRGGDMPSPCRTDQTANSTPVRNDLHDSLTLAADTSPNLNFVMFSPLRRGLCNQHRGGDDVTSPACTLVSATSESTSTFTTDGDNSCDSFFSGDLSQEMADDTPGSFLTLLQAPIITLEKKDENVEELFTIKKRSFPGRPRRFDSSVRSRSKRPSPARPAGESPDLKKRRDVASVSKRFYSLELPAPPKTTLKRFQSASEARIKQALDGVHENSSLISDGSKSYALPTVPGKHQDLTSITPGTLARLLNNEFSDVIEKFLVIDCRYPFEYNGGHIKGALNCYTKERIMETLLTNPITSEDDKKRSIVIFHCEFSSERAPTLSRFLRNMDRQRNSECYPELDYPEVYLLDGGYKNFFENEKALCTPQSYVPMLHADHREDLRTFRTKSKSWPGEKKSRFTLF